MENQLRVGIDTLTGLDLYREVDNFIGGIKEQIITVNYREWLVSPNGTRLEPTRYKKYFVMDVPAVIRTSRVLKTPAVYEEDGVTISIPEEYETIETIITPAITQYTAWKEKEILPQYVGAKLGTDIIIASINATLRSLPVDVIDGYIIKTAE